MSILILIGLHGMIMVVFMIMFPPPPIDKHGLGFRMPAIIIYPYAKPGILIMAVPITINAKIHRMAL